MSAGTRTRRVKDTDRHTVYRFIDAEGTVLRVGCTADLAHRIRQYRYEDPSWWADAVTVITEEHANKPRALAAEKEWLRTYKPKGNQLLHPSRTDYERSPEGAKGTHDYALGQVIGMFLDDDLNPVNPFGGDA